MKTILSVCALLFMISCTEITPAPPISTEVVVIEDYTDSLSSEPDSSSIRGLFDFGTVANGGYFRMLSVRDVSYTPVVEAQISPETDWWNANQFDREDSVNAFLYRVSGLLALPPDTRGHDHSAIYLPLARELNRLAQGKAQKKYLIIYSDLMEHQSRLSFYNPKTFHMLSADPDSVEHMLTRDMPLQSLSGITVYIVYEPADPKADTRFRIVLEFYKNMLESHGATVTITANLTSTDIR